MQAGEGTSLLRASEPKMLLQKEDLSGTDVVVVILLAESVPFVIRIDRPHGSAVGSDLVRDLHGFSERYAGIIPAMSHKQRRTDSIRMVGRADPLKNCSHLRVTFVTI